MSDIKIVLYKDNRAPRHVALSRRTVYQTLFGISLLSISFVFLIALVVRGLVRNRANSTEPTIASQPVASSQTDQLPTQLEGQSLETQVQILKESIITLKGQLENAKKAQVLPSGLDQGKPVLALFSGLVNDKTKEPSPVEIGNIQYSKIGSKEGREESLLSFDLQNSRPGESVQRGYIVVLGRTHSGVISYPPVMTENQPFLLDFEKGETFQVARFRKVNAQIPVLAQSFQILIFSRSGDLLINREISSESVVKETKR